MSATSLKIAVFIDFDNIDIGVKSTLGGHFDAGVVLEALKERGEVVSKIAYADWKRAGSHSRSLTQHAIHMVQRNVTPGGDKNGADINLALDALEMAFTHDHINAFAIVGGDSDFISLVEKLKQYDKKVFVIGGRAFTSVILQKNCTEFVAYENLVAPQAARRPERGRPASQMAISQAFPLVQRALKVLSDREVSPQLGLLKSTLLQLDSTFSERSYGAGSFRDFAEKLAAAGLINLKPSGRNLLVELRDGNGGAATAEPEENVTVNGEAAPAGPASPAAPGAPAAPVVIDPERLAAGVRLVQSLFQSGAAAPRWPMYVRNVKQFLRRSDQAFDERKFGFAGVLDLVRACQRAELFRLERDRRGVLRVYPGAGLLGRAAETDLEREPARAEEQAAEILRFPVVDAREEDWMPSAGTTDAESAESAAAADEAAGGDPFEAEEAAAAARPARRRKSAASASRRATTRTARAPRSRTPRSRAKQTEQETGGDEAS